MTRSKELHGRANPPSPLAALGARLALALALASWGCGAATGDTSGGNGGSQGDTGTFGQDTSPPEITYPRGDRILIHTGHGGEEGNDNGWGQFEGIDEFWKETYGWNTDWRDSLGDDLSSYRMVAFASPGAVEESPFSDDELELLRSAMDDGTRMLVMVEVGHCATETVNQLLEGLGVSMRFQGDAAQEYQVMEATGIATHQLTQGVETLAFSDPCYVEPGDGQAVVQFETSAMVATERPGNGGDVVAVGDFEFLDDSGSHYGDYLVLAQRLAEVDPDLAQ